MVNDIVRSYQKKRNVIRGRKRQGHPSHKRGVDRRRPAVPLSSLIDKNEKKKQQGMAMSATTKKTMIEAEDDNNINDNDEQQTCPHCQKRFIARTNWAPTASTCSQECSALLVRTCALPSCNKTFTRRHTNMNYYCSILCGGTDMKLQGRDGLVCPLFY